MALETSSRACQTGRPSLVGAMTLVHAMGQLRVSAEGERYGLDLHEHGITAYPEYVLSAMGQPGGMRGEGGSQPTMPPAPQVRARAITM